MKTPWYLTWTGIAGLVTALLLAVSSMSSEIGEECELTPNGRRSGSASDLGSGWALETMGTPSQMPYKEEPQPQVRDKGLLGETIFLPAAGGTS